MTDTLNYGFYIGSLIQCIAQNKFDCTVRSARLDDSWCACMCWRWAVVMPFKIDSWFHAVTDFSNI